VALDIFISYAQKDEALCKELHAHLSTLRQQGTINDWFDGNIVPGTEWEPQILSHLNSAQIILLLISADFLASEFCYSIALRRAIERHQAKQARVLPIILRPVDWEGAPFAILQPLPTYGKPVTQWDSHDDAFTDVVKGIRRAIQDLNSSPSPNSDSPLTGTGTTVTGQEQVPIGNIPFPQNPYFTGRDDVLDRLHNTFIRQGKKARPQIISGLGGIGKTQTALEYAYRYSKEYRYTFWVKADTQELLQSDFTQIAEILDLPLKDEKDQALTILEVKRWLKTHDSWLLILDNADDLEPVLKFLPSGLQGHILMTTRAPASGIEAQGEELEKMNAEEGLLFLLRRVKIIASDALIDDSIPQADQNKAKEIVELLDGLPLALAQAGAYIERTRCGFSGYLERYQVRPARLLSDKYGLTADHPDPVAKTWSLSFEKVEQTNLAAADLLRVCAFLHADAIPEAIFIKGASELSTSLQSIANDIFDFDDAITELFKYSLIRRNFDKKTLTIHRLVQDILKDSMDEGTQRQWSERIIRAVNKTYPNVEFSTWQTCDQLIPQAQICVRWIEQWQMIFPEAAQLLHKAGKHLSDRGQYPEAEQFLTKALAIYKQSLEKAEHPDIAANLNDLGELYRLRGRYTQAEQTHKQALTIREHILEPTHPDIATSLHNLARAYHRQGLYSKAEPLYQRALSIREETLGQEHPDTTMSFHDLAFLYQDQSLYAKAEPLLQRALSIREHTLGPDHPDTATSLNNLASLYQDQSLHAKAEPLLQRALSIREHTLGPNHPYTASSLNNLAFQYEAQGKLIQAESLLKQALAIQEKVLGPRHPDTARSLANLAAFYADKNNFKQSESFFQRALKIFEQTLGYRHPYTISTLESYLVFLLKANRKQRAAEIRVEIEEARKQDKEEDQSN
jgi:tetratricopeptide (TPR) repeat protein